MRKITIKPPHNGKFPERPGLTWAKAQAALHYLTLWGFHPDTINEPSTVEINICYDGEITAYYMKDARVAAWEANTDPDKGPRPGMLMVAVWRHATAEYTFHT